MKVTMTNTILGTLSLLDLLVIVVFMLAILWISLYYGRKSNSMSGFFLSGRNLPWYIAGTAMVATTFAADTPLAVTELVAKNGIAGNWLWWNMAIGGLLTVFFFAKLWRRAGVLTDLEFIELRYDGKPAAFLRGFRALYLGLLMNAVILGLGTQGDGKNISGYFPGHRSLFIGGWHCAFCGCVCFLEWIYRAQPAPTAFSLYLLWRAVLYLPFLLLNYLYWAACRN